MKKFLWKLLATIVGADFNKEYQEAMKSDPQIFLKNLLFHAYNNVPYYHNILGEAGVVKKGKLCLADFYKIPVLTKEIMRRRASELISRDCRKRKWFYNASSGSTGEPAKFIQDSTFIKWVMVTSKYYYEDMLGISEAFAKKILLWSAPRDSLGLGFGLRASTISNALTNTLFLEPFTMTEDVMSRFVRTINSYKPEIIRGYAGSLYELCRFIERKKLSVFSPKIVASSAETLHGTMRKKIESVFGSKVYDFYGSRETDGIAGECRCGLSHIFTFNNYVEVLDHHNHTVKEGEEGRIITTNLHNFSMPMIRYDIGDMAILGPEKCKCGNSLPTLSKVTGRQIDYFKREDGRIIYGGYFIELLWTKDWIKAFKVIQEDYKRLRILVALRDGTSNEHEKREIEEKIRSVMGRDCNLKWEVVDEIPKTKAGKYLHIQSMLKD